MPAYVLYVSYAYLYLHFGRTSSPLGKGIEWWCRSYQYTYLRRCFRPLNDTPLATTQAAYFDIPPVLRTVLYSIHRMWKQGGILAWGMTRVALMGPRETESAFRHLPSRPTHTSALPRMTEAKLRCSIFVISSQSGHSRREDGVELLSTVSRGSLRTLLAGVSCDCRWQEARSPGVARCGFFRILCSAAMPTLRSLP